MYYLNGSIDDLRIYDSVLGSLAIGKLYSQVHLAGLWPMDTASGSTTPDISLNGYTGSFYGNPAINESGVVNAAIELDGNDYISVSGDVLDVAEPFSLFTWVKGSKPAGSDFSLIFQQEDDSSGGIGRGILYWNSATDKLGSGLASGLITPNAVFDTEDVWIHVGITYDGDTAALYVNGQQEVSVSSVTLSACGGDFRIGAHKTSATDPYSIVSGDPADTFPIWDKWAPFDGLFDDVRIYNCVISDDEIAELSDMPDRFYYDDLGNRTGTLVSETGLEHEYSSNEVNQYEQIDSEQLYYDDAGNLIGDDRGYQYDYDFENRLVKVHDFGDTLLVEYEYDALGRRIIKREYDSQESVDKTVRYYHNDRWQVVNMATDFADAADEDIENEFVYGNGIDEPLVMYSFIDNEPNSLETYYYCSDNLGSTVALVDSSGAVVERYSYDVWGEPTIYDSNGNEIDESAVSNPFMFTAREVDFLDGGNLILQHNRHRVLYYRLAMWMQPDPKGYVDGLNLYQYVMNNPILLLDPYGKAAIIGPLYPDDNPNIITTPPDVGPIIPPDTDEKIPDDFRWGGLGAMNELRICGNIRLKYAELASKIKMLNKFSPERDLLKLRFRSIGSTPMSNSFVSFFENVQRPLLDDSRTFTDAQKTNAILNRCGRWSQAAGNCAITIGVCYSIYNISVSDDKEEELVNEAGKWVGSIGGAKIGAAYGSRLGLPGAIGGAFIGGLLGEEAIDNIDETPECYINFPIFIPVRNEDNSKYDL